MLFPIVVLIVAIAVIVITIKWSVEMWDYGPISILEASLGIIGRTFVTVLSGLLVLAVFVGAFGSAVNSSTKDIRTIGEQTVKIKSLGNGASQTGSFYITLGTGSGSTETKKIINFVRLNDDGTYSLTQADADKSTIREVDGEKSPHVVITTKQKFADWLVHGGLDKFDTYEFVVPAGTVGDEISIDVNN